MANNTVIVVGTVAAEVRTAHGKMDALQNAVAALPHQLIQEVDRISQTMYALLESRIKQVEEGPAEKLGQVNAGSATTRTVARSGIGFEDSASNADSQRGPAHMVQPWFCRQYDIQPVPFVNRRQPVLGGVQAGRTKLELRHAAEAILKDYGEHIEAYRATHGTVVEIMWTVPATMHGFG